MTLYYYMYRCWQDCCRRGENRSWPSVSVESVDSEYWCLNSAFVYAFIMRLTVEERVLRSTFKLNTLCVCVCVCVCVYIYIYIYIYMALIGLSAVLCGIVGIATGWTNRSSKPGQRFCHLQTRPDRLWDTRSVSYRGSSPVGGWGRRPERDVVHSFLSNADVDTEW